MANWRSAPFELPEAQHLADLYGVLADLNKTAQLCERLLEAFRLQQNDWLLLEALCAAAIVQYGRTFPSGVRDCGVTHELVEGLGNGLADSHQFFKDCRDKWIAHSVNTFEENQVRAWLVPPERGDAKVYNISVQQGRVGSLSPTAIEALLGLVQALATHYEQLLEREKENVLRYAQSLDPKRFYEATDLPAFIPGSKHPRTVRSRRK